MRSRAVVESKASELKSPFFLYRSKRTLRFSSHSDKSRREYLHKYLIIQGKIFLKSRLVALLASLQNFLRILYALDTMLADGVSEGGAWGEKSEHIPWSLVILLLPVC